MSVAKKDTRAVISTKYGELEVKFYFDVAPRHCENFLKLAAVGFYNGTTFHRVNPPGLKVVQGGDPNSKTMNRATHGLGGPGYTIPAEFNSQPHRRGTLSMARGNDPNSAGSQFFICLGNASFLDKNYTAFGQLTGGDDVLGKIGDTPVKAGNSGEKSKPLTRVGVESIRIVPKEK